MRFSESIIYPDLSWAVTADGDALNCLVPTAWASMYLTEYQRLPSPLLPPAHNPSIVSPGD